MGRIFIISLVFAFLFPIHVLISSRHVVLAISLVFLIYDEIYKKQGIFVFYKKIRKPIKLSLWLSLISFFTAIINGVIDPLYLYALFSTIIYILSAWGILRIIYLYHKKISFELIVFYITCAVLFQCIMSVFMYFSPDIQSMVYSFMQLSPLEEQAIARTPYRFHGIGANFFTLGVVNSMILVLMSPFLIQSDGWRKKFFVTSFFVILIIGLMMSRTTIVALPFVFYVLYRKSVNVISQLIGGILSVSLIGYILYITFKDNIFSFYNENSNLVEFGFEMFFNFFSGDGFSTGSSDSLSSVFYLPDNLLTFIIGDGRCSDPRDPELGYYMNTDLGVCRQIFYFGLVGLYIWILYNLQLYKSTCKKYPEYKIVLLMLLLLCYTLDYKGIVNFTPFFALFLFNNEDFIYNKIAR